MYADEEARAGVLEPEGIVNIKFKRDKQLETMARLDATYGELKRRTADKTLSQEQLSALKLQMTEREALLLPVYAQIALQFADLHDRAGRMLAKGAIRRALRWRDARRFFYWRLRRRLHEDAIVKSMAAMSPRAPTAREGYLETLRAWCTGGGSVGSSSSSSSLQFDQDDRAVATWYEEHRKEINARLEKRKQETVADDVAALLRSSKEGGLKGVAQVLSMLPVAEKEKVIKFLSSQ